MPCDLRLEAADCHSSIAVLPLAKSLTDWFCAYSALPAGIALSFAIRSTYCLTAATALSLVKSGLPSAVKKSAPCCLAKTKTWWMFSERLEPSAPSGFLPLALIFLPSATSSAHVAGGSEMPASAKICLL